MDGRDWERWPKTASVGTDAGMEIDFCDCLLRVNSLDTRKIAQSYTHELIVICCVGI